MYCAALCSEAAALVSLFVRPLRDSETKSDPVNCAISLIVHGLS